MICNKYLRLTSLILLSGVMTGCAPESDPDTIFVSSYPVYLLVKEVV